jgi:hypothetical protein
LPKGFSKEEEEELVPNFLSNIKYLQDYSSNLATMSEAGKLL